jgi:alpha-D-xyloside xylohydrolase
MTFILSEKDNQLKVVAGSLIIQITKTPFKMSFSDQQGNLLTSLCDIGLKAKGKGSPTHWVKFLKSHLSLKDKFILNLAAENLSEAQMVISQVAEEVIRFELKGWDDLASIKVNWTLEANDHFYGFGERFDDIDQKGKEVELWVENGAYGGKTYKPIPFFMTPRGYGMMLDTNHRALCRMGRPDSEDYYSITNCDKDLNLYFIYGPKMKDILSRYLELVGKPALPEDWVFGVWKSRDWLVETQATVYADLEIQRELKVPCTVKLIDAAWETEYHSFIFDPDKYPTPAKMFEDAKRLGYKIILWVAPWMMEGTESFAQAETKGYLVKKADGSIYVNRLGNDPGLKGAVIDFTNPEAKAWWQSNLSRLMDMGAAGFKTDFGEQVAEDAVFYNGRTGAEMHNLFPKLYNEITWEVVGPRQGFLLARSAWHGSQAFPGIWAGDQSPDFCPWSGMPSVIRAGLSAGMSGFPYWTSDIGGYFGSPDKKVYIRWAQFGAFSPMMQVHGMGEHDPWNFDAETLHIYRGYAELHTRLVPYIYNNAVYASETGCPIMRALVLEYQDDPQVYALETAAYQYMFGESLLVAPVFFGGNIREVYLPEGKWIDWWTGEEHLGPKIINYHVASNVIPVFIKKGSIIPMLPSGVETLLPVETKGIVGRGQDLELEVYPEEESILKMHDGQEFRVIAHDTGLRVDFKNVKTKELTIKLMGLSGLEPEKTEGCKVVGCAPAIPATANIERRAYGQPGTQFVITPQCKEGFLEVRKSREE